MTDPHFFGYGSLVNGATYDHAATPVQLSGWRRVWCQTALHPWAYLSVLPCIETTIEGIIAPVPGGDWAALDLREASYGRQPCASQIIPASGDDIAVYSVPKASFATDIARKPILLSYLDVVLQGYLQVFGTDGAQAFFDTTDGWDAPILNDRAAPHYPRAQTLTPAQTWWVDDAIGKLPAVM